MMCWYQVLRRYGVPAKFGGPGDRFQLQLSAFRCEPDDPEILWTMPVQDKAFIAFEEFSQPSDAEGGAEVRAMWNNGLAENAGEFHDFKILRTSGYNIANHHFRPSSSGLVFCQRAASLVSHGVITCV